MSQVKRPDKELYNALAWDGTRPSCVSNGSASAAAISESTEAVEHFDVGGDCNL